MLKYLIRSIVLLTVMYFIIGFFVTQFADIKTFTFDVYLKYGGIFGGLASILSLWAFTISSISTKSLKDVELEIFRKVGELAGEMQKFDTDIKEKSKEVNNLEIRKKQLELLVRKASLVHFLRAKLEQNNATLIELYNNNKTIKNQLSSLDEEIKETGQEKFIEEIIEIVNNKEQTYLSAISGVIEMSIPIIPFILAFKQRLNISRKLNSLIKKWSDILQ